MYDDSVPQFEDLISRARSGDEQAAAEILRHYEPEIRREVRVRLTDPRLRRSLDSTDICQSVFANFFVRIALGQFDFSKPQHLLRLLAQMATNKVIDAHRREKSRRPNHGDFVEVFDAEGKENTPSEIVAGGEMLSRINGLLSPQEQEVAKLRRSGKSWQEIALTLNQNVDALRKRLARAYERVAAELDIA